MPEAVLYDCTREYGTTHVHYFTGRSFQVAQRQIANTDVFGKLPITNIACWEHSG